ncbi:hypothetical protein [Rhodoplanes sp. SY1]|uniref:hypothetical protein n=1 Tax=Rhodoplanes sp. SY1 TaxID=3166646 RepID=UPI0038B4BF10
MHSLADIFSLWPSDADLGRDMEVPYSTVASWKQRGSIPPAYWRDFILLARRRGHPEIDADFLVRLHARTPAPGAARGFGEDDAATFHAPPESSAPAAVGATAGGHFSRHRAARRARFQTGREIEDHVDALREEWSHR